MAQQSSPAFKATKVSLILLGIPAAVCLFIAVMQWIRDNTDKTTSNSVFAVTITLLILGIWYCLYRAFKG